MNSRQAEQCARIIENVFKYEESINPHTIVLMFRKMAVLYSKFELSSPEDEG